MQWEAFDPLIQTALEEDGARADVTTDSLIDPALRAVADVVVKAPGVICGLPAARRTAHLVDPRLEVETFRQDGDEVGPGEVVACVRGSAASILRAERTMLNFLQHLSGVATATHKLARLVEGTGAAIYDTRKTPAGWRALDKYAVRCGGGRNHRMGLSDQVLIKDNHLKLRAGTTNPTAAAVGEAVRTARRAAPGLLVEVEVTALDELREAVRAGADIVMLDNMSPDQVRRAVEEVRRLCAGRPRPELEASGGITPQTVRAYAEAGVDRISVGALTHSAQALDISMLIR
jgi:nicotinate-nucleotide pyrophosphorylase (carboxylating)